MGVILRADDEFRLKGTMRVFERKEGSKIWTFAGDFSNILLNQFYLDLFTQLQPGAPGGVSLALANLALGYGAGATFNRPDTGLVLEWSTTIATLTSATGVAAINTLATTAIPMALSNGVTVTLGASGTPQNLTVNPGEVSGATSVRVNSFTPNQNWPIGTPVIYSDITKHIPQRLSVVIGTTSAVDPVSGTWSFYLPASANSIPVTFTEAGLLYQANIKFGSHVAFAYTKAANTDVTINYTITRSLT